MTKLVFSPADHSGALVRIYRIRGQASLRALSRNPVAQIIMRFPQVEKILVSSSQEGEKVAHHVQEILMPARFENLKKFGLEGNQPEYFGSQLRKAGTILRFPSN